MLTMLEIVNYGKIKNLTLNNLSVINIISGRNNIGKSDVLYYMDSYHPTVNQPFLIYLLISMRSLIYQI